MGDSLAEARKMALEAVTDHLALLLADGDAVSPHLAAKPDRTPKGGVVETLEVPEVNVRARVPVMRRSLEQARRKKRVRCLRLNITLPEDLVGRADDYARKHHETRSGLIAQGLEKLLKKGA